MSNIFHRTLFMAVAVLFVPGALAVTFTVNSTADQPDDLTSPGVCHTAANTCTLRAAVMQANRTTGAGATIMIPAGTYALVIPVIGLDGEGSGDLNLTAPSSGNPITTIIGAGAGVTIIDGNQLDRVFNVQSGRTATISGVTIQNGYAGNGGGIFNAGTLNLSNVTIRGNHAALSGGGGGVRNFGTMTVTNSTIANNSAAFSGGGIANYASLTVTGSTISQNTAGLAGFDGGGVKEAGTDLSITGSTISGNTAASGGGVSYTGQLILLTNTTVSGNAASQFGGGIYIGAPGSAAFSTTIAFNHALIGGGGVAVASNSSFSLRNALVAGNYLDTPSNTSDCSGHFNLYGVSMFWNPIGCGFNDTSGFLAYLNDLSSVSALQYNGGPTLTHALLPGSNAIDGSDPATGCQDAVGALLATDQRGFPRVVGARCDIGAFELATLDVDYSNTASKYDALTDGLLIVRYFSGLTGPALTTGALGGTATRTDPTAIKLYLDGIRSSLDIDGNGTTDALTDGLLILRYLFGLRGNALIAGALGPLPTRSSAADIEAYIQALMP